MKRWHRLAALTLLAVSLSVIYQALVRQGVMVAGQPGPGFMPLGLGALLCVLAVSLLLTSLGDDPTPQPFWAGRAWGRPVTAVALIAGFSAALPRTGFVPGVGLLVLCWLLVLERKPAWVAAAMAIATSAIVHLVFVVALRVPLPSGTLLGR